MIEQKEEEQKKKSATERKPSSARDDTLYAQIAASDEMVVQTQRRNSFLMAMMVSYMRLTLTIDAKRREYQKEFHVLGVIWSVCMSFLYLCGVLMFTILVVSYMQFPSYVKAYLNQNGILYDRMEIPGYIVSQIELYGLHNQEQTYKINHVSVSSTFADFLNRRAKNVSLRGLRLLIDQTGKGNSDGLLSPISQLNEVIRSSDTIRIDSLEVSDAILTVKGKNYELPISVSLTGVYGRDVNISAFVSIDEPYLSLKGSLFVRDVGDGINWNLDIQDGSIVFPGRPRETLRGKIVFKTKKGQILSVNTNIRLLYERIEKKLALLFEQDNKAQYKGELSLTWTDMSSATTPVERTNITLGLSGVMFTTEGRVKTDQPMDVKFSSVYASQLQVKDLIGTLNGELSCQMNEGCAYTLKKPSTLNVAWLRLPIMGVPINSVKGTRLTLTPTNNTFNLSWKEGVLQFNIDNQNFNFQGNQAETKISSVLSVGKSNLKGQLNLWDKRVLAAFSASNINYNTPNIEIKKASLAMDDVIYETGKTYFKSPYVLLRNNEYLKVPFASDYVRQDNYSEVAISLENKKIQAAFAGYFDDNTGAIDGRFIVPTVNLSDIKGPLSRFSPLFSDDVLSVTGKLAAYGFLKGNIYGNLDGPIYTAFSDVSLKTKELQIDKINTALTIQSVRPFMTDTEQEVSVGAINAFVPIENIRLLLRLDNKFAQLTKLTAVIAGVQLDAEPTLVPYRDVGTLLYLKNKDADLSNVTKVVSLKNWAFDGAVHGSLLIPLEVKDFGIDMKTAIIQLSEVALKYTGKVKDKPAFLEKNNQFEIQSGTISIDKSEDEKKVKTTFALDTLIGFDQKRKIKKLVRYTFEGGLSEVLHFPKEKNIQAPESVIKRINQVFKMIEAAKK